MNKDRFLNYDLLNIALNSNRIDLTDDEHEIEFDAGEFTITLSIHLSLIEHPPVIPLELQDVLNQFNNIDNLVQERLLDSPHDPEYHPAVIYMQEDRSIFIDYWSTKINNQWSVNLEKSNNKWLPIF
jgi:hypothetical protein